MFGTLEVPGASGSRLQSAHHAQPTNEGQGSHQEVGGEREEGTAHTRSAGARAEAPAQTAGAAGSGAHTHGQHGVHLLIGQIRLRPRRAGRGRGRGRGGDGLPAGRSGVEHQQRERLGRARQPEEQLQRRGLLQPRQSAPPRQHSGENSQSIRAHPLPPDLHHLPHLHGSCSPIRRSKARAPPRRAFARLLLCDVQTYTKAPRICSTYTFLPSPSNQPSRQILPTSLPSSPLLLLLHVFQRITHVLIAPENVSHCNPTHLSGPASFPRCHAHCLRRHATFFHSPTDQIRTFQTTGLGHLTGQLTYHSMEFCT